MYVAQPEPDRQRDDERKTDRDRGDLHGPERVVRERREVRLPRQLAVARDELEGLDEVVHVSRAPQTARARAHGTRSRWSPTSSASAAIAKATANAPAAISSVLNTELLIALRIGTPSPSLTIKGCDRCQRDRCHGRDSKTRDDCWQRKRQLDPQQHLTAAHAHPHSGFPHVGPEPHADQRAYCGRGSAACRRPTPPPPSRG